MIAAVLLIALGLQVPNGPVECDIIELNSQTVGPGWIEYHIIGWTKIRSRWWCVYDTTVNSWDDVETVGTTVVWQTFPGSDHVKKLRAKHFVAERNTHYDDPVSDHNRAQWPAWLRP